MQESKQCFNQLFSLLLAPSRLQRQVHCQGRGRGEQKPKGTWLGLTQRQWGRGSSKVGVKPWMRLDERCMLQASKALGLGACLHLPLPIQSKLGWKWIEAKGDQSCVPKLGTARLGT